LHFIKPISNKGGRSANKFRKLQKCKFADLIFILFGDFLQMWQFADLRFGDFIFFGDLWISDLQILLFFADLKLPQIHNFSTNKA
jgi:hypothetical protein